MPLFLALLQLCTLTLGPPEWLQNAYRSTPWAAQRDKDASTSTVVQILMVSESNVCRSVLAEAIMKQQLAECGLSDMVQVQSKVNCTTLSTVPNRYNATTQNT